MNVSVITAVYNGECYLQECIDSILNQTYKDFEYIIVNDGSTDGTKEILNKIVDDRVTIIHSQKNKGAATSLNIGIETAKGKWIAIQDADDISRPTKLEEQIEYLKQNPNVIGVSSLIKCIHGKGSISKSFFKDLEDGYNLRLDKGEFYKKQFCSCSLCHGTVMFSKKAFNKVGKYDPTYTISYDYDLWLRFFKSMPIGKVSKILYEYRVSSTSLSNTNSQKINEELLMIATKHILNQLYFNIKMKPKIIIIGPETGYSFFGENIKPNFEMKIYDYIKTKEKQKSLQVTRLVKKGKVDAVLVMNDDQANDWIRRLTLRGLTINKDLFLIWNYRDRK
ncbi:glycosyltransferase [Bacillus cereus]|uniref:glycosyltransferase n=1 Tax=Bacillus cereus TaxID=1396 RepID=UPI00356D8A7B